MKTETKAAHTPGPWKVTCTEIDYVEVSAGEGRFFTVAKACGFSMPEAEANARLIAAAPDLLEALQNVAAGIRAGANIPAWLRKELEHSIEPAIAKANENC